MHVPIYILTETKMPPITQGDMESIQMNTYSEGGLDYISSQLDEEKVKEITNIKGFKKENGKFILNDDDVKEAKKLLADKLKEAAEDIQNLDCLTPYSQYFSIYNQLQYTIDPLMFKNYYVLIREDDIADSEYLSDYLEVIDRLDFPESVKEYHLNTVFYGHY